MREAVLIDHRVGAPHRLDNLLPRHHGVAVLDQRGQQPQLKARDLGDYPAVGNDALCLIDMEVVLGGRQGLGGGRHAQPGQHMRQAARMLEFRTGLAGGIGRQHRIRHRDEAVALARHGHDVAVQADGA
ncbi:hypothetical protein D3C87_1164720 [compost metagenome]